jgi:hypothetical protein
MSRKNRINYKELLFSILRLLLVIHNLLLKIISLVLVSSDPGPCSIQKLL